MCNSRNEIIQNDDPQKRFTMLFLNIGDDLYLHNLGAEQKHRRRRRRRRRWQHKVGNTRNGRD